MISQSCPNCQKTHDVSVFVSGQRVLCACGIRFEVKRTDVSAPPRPAEESPQLTDAQRLGKDNGASTRREPPEAPQEPQEPIDKTFITHGPRVYLPGYELGEILGRGGMGEVWRARQLSLGREVAVKLLPPKLAKDPEFVARFEKEAAALAAVSHPNIIQIIDRGTAQDHYFFVMELVRGQSLRDLVAREPLSPVDALKVVLQILRAVESAHAKEIIHRDLKPENILVDDRGHVKVADFGLAGMRSQDSGQAQLTGTAVAMGTINYMAPEQRRDAKHVDGRADLYSVGVILYELLTRELPVGRFKLPGERIAGLDGRIDQVLERALQPDAAARFPNATEMLRALEPILGDSSSLPALGSSARAPAGSGSGVATVAMRRQSVLRSGWNGLRTGLTVLGALALVGIGAKFLWPKQHTEPRPLPPNTEDQVYSSITQDPTADGLVHLTLPFDDGDEQLNCHAGTWSLRDSKLFAIQAGNAVAGSHLKIVPRAYLAHRYFSSDDFTARVEVTLNNLEADYPVEATAQRFAELAFRIKDLQVSVFAVPGAGVKLAWRYLLPNGAEVQGDTADEVGKLLADEVVLPPDGTPFQLTLSLRKKKGGVEVQAAAGGQQFIKKLLPGLEGRTAKVAVGCRNMHCTFDGLDVVGLSMPRPRREGEVAAHR